jgi:uncharacterized membrane protein YbhN (UPF0104 family)
MSAATAVPEIPRDEIVGRPDFDRRQLRRRVIVLGLVILAVVAVITLVPGLSGLRARFTHARPGWLVLGGAFKLLSALCYVAAFRAIFCQRMSWRLSAQIGLAELGANAVVPTGGVGGLALGVWALRRTGMSDEHIARRSVAFFFLTSVPNVLGVIILGLGLALGVFDGRASLALSLLPALVAAAAIVLTVAGGRRAGRAQRRAAGASGADARRPRVLGAIAGGVDEALALLRRHDPWLVVGLVGYLGFDLMVLWSTFHAFGSGPPVAIISIGYLIGELGGLLPVPGGLGGVDLGLVGTLVLYHVPVGAATAAVLAYRALALWVPAVVGSIAFLALRRSLSNEAVAVSGCGPGEEIEVIGRGRVRLRS